MFPLIKIIHCYKKQFPPSNLVDLVVIMSWTYQYTLQLWSKLLPQRVLLGFDSVQKEYLKIFITSSNTAFNSINKPFHGIRLLSAKHYFKCGQYHAIPERLEIDVFSSHQRHVLLRICRLHMSSNSISMLRCIFMSVACYCSAFGSHFALMQRRIIFSHLPRLLWSRANNASLFPRKHIPRSIWHLVTFLMSFSSLRL